MSISGVPQRPLPDDALPPTSGDYVAPGTLPYLALDGHREAERRARRDDQVDRAKRMQRANPGLRITTPRQNGSNRYRAEWGDVDGEHASLTHWDLRPLLDKLARMGFADPDPE